MRFSIEKNQLADMLSVATRAMASKSTMPVLEGILVTAQKGTITMSCTDMLLGITVQDAAIVEEEGTAVFPGRMFYEIIRRLPEGDVSIEIKDDTAAVIRCQQSRTTTSVMDPEEFPMLPQVDETTSVTLKRSVLRDMIRHTLFATAVETTRPILMGALLECTQEEITMVALDGYRLALWREEADGQTPFSAVIPSKALSELVKLLGDGDGEIKLSIDRSHLMTQVDNITVVTQLLEGEYMKYRQIIPAGFTTRLKVSTRLLADAIDRASLVVREGGSNLVRFKIEEGQMIITANSQLGDVYDCIPCELDGNGMEIAFNAKYFTDVLRTLEEEEIEMNLTTSISPCVVKSIDDDKFLYLVLPVRIAN